MCLTRVQGMQFAGETALKFLEEYKTPIEMDSEAKVPQIDRKILTEIAQTSLRTKSTLSLPTT